jgi:hypothetical protein
MTAPICVERSEMCCGQTSTRQTRTWKTHAFHFDTIFLQLLKQLSHLCRFANAVAPFEYNQRASPTNHFQW